MGSFTILQFKGRGTIFVLGFAYNGRLPITMGVTIVVFRGPY